MMPMEIHPELKTIISCPLMLNLPTVVCPKEMREHSLYLLPMFSFLTKPRPQILGPFAMRQAVTATNQFPVKSVSRSFARRSFKHAQKQNG
jgi:hypothetical protein